MHSRRPPTESTFFKVYLLWVSHYKSQASNSQEVDTLSEEDEAVASDLDLHALIAAQSHTEPMVQSAEEVIKEIDDLMQVKIYI